MAVTSGLKVRGSLTGSVTSAGMRRRSISVSSEQVVELRRLGLPQAHHLRRPTPAPPRTRPTRRSAGSRPRARCGQRSKSQWRHSSKAAFSSRRLDVVDAAQPAERRAARRPRPRASALVEGSASRSVTACAGRVGADRPSGPSPRHRTGRPDACAARVCRRSRRGDTIDVDGVLRPASPEAPPPTFDGAAPPPPIDPLLIDADEGPMRGDLRRQIQELERVLQRLKAAAFPWETHGGQPAPRPRPARRRRTSSASATSWSCC